MRAQTDRILDHMATGKAITPLQALNRYGCMRLGARIYDLKRDGHRIVSERISRGGKTFAQYRLAH